MFLVSDGAYGGHAEEGIGISLPETVFAFEEVNLGQQVERLLFSVPLEYLNDVDSDPEIDATDSLEPPETVCVAQDTKSETMEGAVPPPAPPLLPAASVSTDHPKPEPRKRYDAVTTTQRELLEKLQDAVAEGSCKDVKLAVENVIDINDFNRPGNENALHQAVLTNREEIVTLLLDSGADINFPSRDTRMTALHFAARMNNVKMVNLLIEKGADINALMLHKSTPLRTACLARSTEVVDVLLQQRGIDLNLAERHGRTPLITAVDTGDHTIVKRLIQAGCDVSRYDSQRRNAIHYAVRRRYGDIVRTLAAAGGNVHLEELIPNIDLADKRGLTPLIMATRAGFLDMMHILLECGANPDMFGRVGGWRAFTAVWEAVQCGDSRALKILVDAGANVNAAEDEHYGSPLFALFMCTHSRPDILHILLDAGIDVNYRDANNYSALHLAVDTERLELATILYSADYDARNDVAWMTTYLESRMTSEARDLIEYALQHYNQPILLKAQVRLLIRKVLANRRPLYKAVENMDLPHQLVEFILYHDRATHGKCYDTIYSSDDADLSSD